MKTALLIIDIQNDYFTGGKMELVGAEAAALKARELLQCFREHKSYHIHIQHEALGPNATFFIRGTDGISIHDSVAHFEGEPLVIKNFPNSFRETNLLSLLQENNIERVVVCGMMTHMCVDATARAAADFGFRVLIAEDACATRALIHAETTVPADHVHKAFMAALKSYGQVQPTDELIAQLAAERD